MWKQPVTLLRLTGADRAGLVHAFAARCPQHSHRCFLRPVPCHSAKTCGAQIRQRYRLERLGSTDCQSFGEALAVDGST